MDRTDEWRLFVAVAGRRSFAQAARTLGRSPQAVTRAVAALEERLGTRLLNRTTRSVSLTYEGERRLERARQLVAELDALESGSAAADAPLAGRLSVTAPVLFGQLHVLPVVHELLSLHPELDVRLTLLDRVVSLAEEGIDVGVRLGALPDSSLRARLVGHVRSLLCASPDYLKRAGVPRSPAALARHTCIAFDGTTPVADRWSFTGTGTGTGTGTSTRTSTGTRRGRAGGHKRLTVTVRARLVVNSAPAAIDAALAGLGIVRVLSYQVARLLRERRLQVVLPSWAQDEVPVQLVQLPGAPTRAAIAFVELALARLRARLDGGA
jgi:DNA-binding transcriptional LysR family regulator